MQSAPGPVTLAVAPNGGRRLKADHPALPLTADELGFEAEAALEAGAAMLHMHVRDPAGHHVLDADAYAAALRAVRSRVGQRLVVQITSESLGRYAPPEQDALIRAVRPEAVSIALRELVPDATQEASFADLLAWMKDARVMPQIILYDAADLARLKALQQRGVIPWDSVPVLFALGRYSAGRIATPQDLLGILAAGPVRPTEWMVCAFGPNEARITAAAALLGADLRIGFENNLDRPDGTRAASNAEQIAHMAQVLRALGVPVRDGPALRAHWQTLLFE